MLKRGAVGIALVAVTTSCYAATPSKPSTPSKPATPGYKKSTINYTCKTVKNNEFNIKVIKNQNSCWVTVEGQNEVTVDNANTASPFYSIMKELPSGVKNGKDYYTIGLTTCNKM